MKTLVELNNELDAKINRSDVKTREGAGRRSFSYLSTDYVIGRMNKLFGNLNWATDTLENKAVFEGQINSKYTCHYIARVKVEAQHIDDQGRVIRTQHVGTGYGDGSDASNPGKAHELAAKEAESDALKRACKNFGQSMGLALYDKDQSMVEDNTGGKISSARGTSTPSSTPGDQVPTPLSVPSAAASTTTPPANIVSDSDGRQVNPPATRPKFDRETVNKSINAHSKIVIAKSPDQAQAKEKLKADMRAKYGTDVKEMLSDDQATELLAELKVQASA